ncbi:MAG: hypothetical protein MJ245_06070 [Clostridia bacterium]|nr:hypothetical protein [Clostridia bacterium]
MVIASKITLKRNFKDFLFPSMISYEDSKIIASEIKNIFKSNRNFKIKEFSEKGSYSELFALNSLNIVSDNFVNNDLEKLLVTNKDYTTTVCVNDTDHITIESLTYDDKILTLYDEVKKIEEKIDSKFPFAFDSKYGYLTSNLNIVGTGMIPSYFLHIPMLELSGQLQTIRNACNKFGYDIRPIFSHDEKSNGGFYEVYTKLTLGISDKEILSNLKIMILKMVEKEKVLRNEILKKEKLRITDEVNRAYGIIMNAKLIKHEEAEVLLSYVKLGSDMKLFDDSISHDLTKLNVFELLNSINDKALELEEDTNDKLILDSLRAKKIQDTFNDLKFKDIL